MSSRHQFDESPPASLSSLAPFSRASPGTFASAPSLPSAPPGTLRPPVSGSIVRSEPSLRSPLLRAAAVNQATSNDEAAALFRSARLPPARLVLWTPLVAVVDLALMIAVVVAGGEFSPFASNPFVGPPFEAFTALGAKDVPLILASGQGWRLLTAMFLHAGLLHFVAAITAKIGAGVLLERRVGAARAAAVYILSGFGGTLASAVFLPEKSVVAGTAPLFGVVAALLAELCVFGAMVRPRPLRFGALATLALLPFVAAGVMPLVDNFAHAFGLLIGFAVALVVHATGALAAQLKRKRALCHGLSGVVLSVAPLVVLLAVFYAEKQSASWCGACHTVSCPAVAEWRCETSQMQ